jgi:hypothetical protein
MTDNREGADMFALRSLLAVLAIGFTASCAHVPRMQTESLQTESLRAEYLQSHPKGPHNAQIVRGEIAKGMDLMEVLASWGVPERRFARKTTSREAWIYVMRDPYNTDYMEYELVFVDRVLSTWTLDRVTSGSGVRAGYTSQTLDTPGPAPAGSYSGDLSHPRK